MLVALRKASEDDAEDLLQMLCEQHSEATVKHGNIDGEKALGNIKRTIERGASYIAETEAGMVGSIGFLVSSDWWSQEKHLADMWFYVRPAYRKSRAAHLLFRAYSETAASMELPVKAGHVDGADVDRKDKFFERFGLVRAGSIFMEGKA